jgi:hypothetical protein
MIEIGSTSVKVLIHELRHIIQSIFILEIDSVNCRIMIYKHSYISLVCKINLFCINNDVPYYEGVYVRKGVLPSNKKLINGNHFCPGLWLKV